MDDACAHEMQVPNAMLKTRVLQKLFKSLKKEKKKRDWEKMDKCSRYLKQWVLRCPPEKKMNKIAPAL